jgi:hypothetical protein
LYRSIINKIFQTPPKKQSDSIESFEEIERQLQEEFKLSETEEDRLSKIEEEMKLLVAQMEAKAHQNLCIQPKATKSTATNRTPKPSASQPLAKKTQRTIPNQGPPQRVIPSAVPDYDDKENIASVNKTVVNSAKPAPHKQTALPKPKPIATTNSAITKPRQRIVGQPAATTTQQSSLIPVLVQIFMCL